MNNVPFVGALLLEVGLRFAVLSKESMSNPLKCLAPSIVSGLVSRYLPMLCELLERRWRRHRRKPRARKIR
jgi:hypothetical protein